MNIFCGLVRFFAPVAGTYELKIALPNGVTVTTPPLTFGSDELVNVQTLCDAINSFTPAHKIAASRVDAVCVFVSLVDGVASAMTLKTIADVVVSGEITLSSGVAHVGPVAATFDLRPVLAGIVLSKLVS